MTILVEQFKGFQDVSKNLTRSLCEWCCKNTAMAPSNNLWIDGSAASPMQNLNTDITFLPGQLTIPNRMFASALRTEKLITISIFPNTLVVKEVPHIVYTKRNTTRLGAILHNTPEESKLCFW